MARSQEIYQGECRFTERSLEVKTHGHGIKLSIRNSPVKGDVVSVFLDAGELDVLTQALNGQSGGEWRRAEMVLGQLANVLHRAGY